MAVILHNPGRGTKRESKPSTRRKSRFGVPLGPYAEELSAALLIKDRGRALSVLMRAVEAEWKLSDVEEFVIAAAVSRLGELWLRGRLSDDEFEQVGALAERVEVAFRYRLVNRNHPGLRVSSHDKRRA